MAISALERVLQNRAIEDAPLHKGEERIARAACAVQGEHRYLARNTPLLAADGSVGWIVHQITPFGPVSNPQVLHEQDGDNARAVLDALAPAIAIVDLDGRVLTANRGWKDSNSDTIPAFLLAAEGENFLATCDSAAGRGNSAAAQLAAGVRAMLNGNAMDVRREFACQIGNDQRWCLVRVSPILHHPTGRLVISREDITEQKLAEIGLRESERRERDRATELSALLDAVPTPVFIAHDPDCIHITGNRAAEEILRLPRGAEASLTAPEDHKPRHFQVLQNGRVLRGEELPAQMAARGHKIMDFEEVILFDDGTKLDMVSYATPLLDEGGKPRGSVLVMVDITERKRAEKALVESQQRLAGIVGSAMDAIISVDSDQRILLFNTAAEKMFRCPAIEAVGTDIDRFIPRRYATEHRKRIKEFGRTGVTSRAMGHVGPLSGRRADGEEFPIEASISSVEVQGEQIYTVILRDITERKRLENEVIEISAREQRRIGQDLHDDLCQWLAATEFFASALAEDLATRSPGDAERVRKIAASMRQANARARLLAHGLAPAVIESAGIAGALRDLVSTACEMYGIKCTYEGPDALEIRDNIAALHLYRIAQEAISNAVRHGGASAIAILLQPIGEQVRMIIRDDGRGIALPPPDKVGMGLGTMRYRAATIGGSLAIKRVPTGGTEVICTFPRHI